MSHLKKDHQASLQHKQLPRLQIQELPHRAQYRKPQQALPPPNMVQQPQSLRQRLILTDNQLQAMGRRSHPPLDPQPVVIQQNQHPVMDRDKQDIQEAVSEQDNDFISFR